MTEISECKFGGLHEVGISLDYHCMQTIVHLTKNPNNRRPETVSKVKINELDEPCCGEIIIGRCRKCLMEIAVTVSWNEKQDPEQSAFLQEMRKLKVGRYVP